MDPESTLAPVLALHSGAVIQYRRGQEDSSGRDVGILARRTNRGGRKDKLNINLNQNL